MDLGWCDVCLRVADAGASLAFYEKLGFRCAEGGRDQAWAVVTNGRLRLGLFEAQFMDEGSLTLNFRGGDVFAIAEALQAKGITFSKGPIRGVSGGCSGTLFDPDGYKLFFDTAPGEEMKEPPGLESGLIQTGYQVMTCPNCQAEVKPQPIVVTDPELTAKQHCVLCGRPSKETPKIIIGAHGGVCLQCVDICNDIINQNASDAQNLD